MKTSSEKTPRGGPGRRFLLNFLLFAVTVVVLFTLTELVMRLLLPPVKTEGNLWRREPNRDYRKSVYTPNKEAIDHGVPTRFNSLGLKNREIDLEKPDGCIRVAMFGDSFTYGIGLAVDETYPSLLERVLVEQAGGRQIEVLNFGVCGLNTFQESMYAVNYGMRFDPDIIVLVWLYNDIDLNGYTYEDLEQFVESRMIPERRQNEIQAAGRTGEIGSFEGRGSATMHLWNLYAWIKARSKLVYFTGMRTKELLQKFGLNLKSSERIIYADLDSDGFRLSFDSITFLARECAKRRIEFNVAVYPPLQKLDDDYYNDLVNRKVERFCCENGISCLNLFDAFRGETPGKLHVSWIDYHPNRYASSIAARATATHLTRNSRMLGEW